MRWKKLLGWNRKRLVISLLIILLIVVFGTLAFYFLEGERTTVSEGEVISNVRAYFENKYLSQQVDNLALFKEVNIKVDNTELRSPEESEIAAIQQVGQELPELLWIVEVTVNPIPVPENMLSISWVIPPPFHKVVYLNAYTGKVLLENTKGWPPELPQPQYVTLSSTGYPKKFKHGS